MAGLGFFFLPIIELKPNRLASGIPYHLLGLEGDLRYLALFVLALAPLLVALLPAGKGRGWLLILLGNGLLVLTFVLPAQAGGLLVENAAELLGEGVRIRNPRLLPSAALALGVMGGYAVLFAGLQDLVRGGVTYGARLLAAWAGAALVVLLFAGGYLDIYSVMVEFYANGEQLARKFLEHGMFVGVALIVGSVIGVGLGLWASRDEHVAPVILWAVGIIQTIPSLALFGVLLVPMARLGDQRFSAVLAFLALALVVAAALLLIYRAFGAKLPDAARQANLLLSALALAVPLALVTVIIATFLYRVALLAFSSGRYGALTNALLLALLAGLILWAAARWLFGRGGLYRFARYAAFTTGAVAGVILVVILFQASGQFLARVAGFAALTVRDLGVSGIGPAPALIALTLYALLPLVRNTYAGLKNVDAAIIDSGRGMGMTAAQRFFQIELPLAFPIIMAGVRNAGVALVGIGAIASVIGAGGLGDFIFSGIISTSIDLILLGTIPAVFLALFLDAALRGLEALLTSPGIRHAAEGEL